jgi:hypothetical protein
MERMEVEGLRDMRQEQKTNPDLDAITWKESVELRDAIRSGKTTKEAEAKVVVA